MAKKTIRIESLAFNNFKGLENFKLKNLGNTVSIYGDNELGKTTIFDGFTWLISDKDSLNSAVFEIKTLDTLGNVVHGLEHQVDMTLDIDGEKIQFKKVYLEEFTKRRGEAQKTFTGHTINRYIDNLPKMKKEFDAVIDAICDKETFKILTNPRHFNEVMTWAARRKLLFEVCGSLSDKDVIAASPELKGLPAILGKRTVEDHQKLVKNRQSKINEEIAKIPVRIDENTQSIIPVPRGAEQLSVEVYEASADLTRLNKELLTLESGGGIAAKKQELAEVERDIIHKVNNQQTVIYNLERIRKQDIAALESTAFDAADAVTVAVDDQHKLQDEKIKLQLEISEFETAMHDLRQKWHAQDKVKFIHSASLNCPHCGQDLPEDQITAARESAQGAFNEAQAKTLSAIADQGKNVLNTVNGHKLRIGIIDTIVKQYNSQIADLEEKHQAAVVAWDKLRLADLPEVKPDPEHDTLLAKKELILDAIGDLNAGIATAAQEYREKIEVATVNLASLEADIKQHEANARILARNVEHKISERVLAAEFEKLESELFLIEKFIRLKVDMVEGPINSRFKLARFQLFTENINGGLEPCCNTTFEGVPYNSMNNAARINIGLDIINTLSDFYGISMPVFIDNAEAITQLIKTDSQQIKLVVSEMDKTLRVEIDINPPLKGV